MKTTLPSLDGLDLLASAVIILDANGGIVYANAAAENLLESSFKVLSQQKLSELFLNGKELATLFYQAVAHQFADKRLDLVLERMGREPLQVHTIVTALDNAATPVLLELRENAQQLKLDREERLLDQSQANRELIRNLAHEIKNPLGGIRGAAQLLDRELDRPNLHEYTQVIMKEADRLQSLMDRLLTPHRLPQLAPLNIHEVLERVRSLILAEYPQGVTIQRDYDTSLPLLHGDKEQLIQVVLNIMRNAAQAMSGNGQITLKTRVARQATLARRRYKHALELQISDTGPGIAEDMRERIFYPLVSGREGGSGLGLTLAQTFVTQHHGAITFESQPGNTTFTLLLPINYSENGK